MNCPRGLLLSAFVCLLTFSQDTFGFDLPKEKAIKLKRIGKLDFGPIQESSGIVRSRMWPDWIWTHNDSGDKARIFATNRNGAIVQPARNQGSYEGVIIVDAVNIDWEDIATDDKGNLIIGAFGNNSNARRDLAIYLVPEPNATYELETRIFQKFSFQYAEQKEFPPLQNNFDCEAVFFAHGKIYLLTKHRSDTLTTLYRFENLNPGILNTPAMIGTFDAKGPVTAADVSQDGTKLAVLTYKHIWLFETEPGKDNYFEGEISWAPLNPLTSKQCEGVCFWENTLIISNEQRELFEISISDLHKLKL